jgi:hypothetical protein
MVEVAKLGVLTGAKAQICKIKRFRGFENPLPRTEVRGWHSSIKIRVYPKLSFAAVCKVVS